MTDGSIEEITPFAATHKLVGSLQFTKSPRGPTLRFYEKRTKGVPTAHGLCPGKPLADLHDLGGGALLSVPHTRVCGQAGKPLADLHETI